VGDDIADLQVLKRVGLPIAVANAVSEVKAAAAYVTHAPGGHGAVREVIEVLLRARGEWAGILERYFAHSERTETADRTSRTDMVERGKR